MGEVELNGPSIVSRPTDPTKRSFASKLGATLKSTFTSPVRIRPPVRSQSPVRGQSSQSLFYPAEVYGQIISYIDDQPTLFALLFIHPHILPEAERIIYRSPRVRRPDLVIILLQSVKEKPTRGSCIKTLYLRVWFAEEQSWRLLADVLENWLPVLVELDIDSPKGFPAADGGKPTMVTLPPSTRILTCGSTLIGSLLPSSHIANLSLVRSVDVDVNLLAPALGRLTSFNLHQTRAADRAHWSNRSGHEGQTGALLHRMENLLYLGLRFVISEDGLLRYVTHKSSLRYVHVHSLYSDPHRWPRPPTLEQQLALRAFQSSGSLFCISVLHDTQTALEVDEYRRSDPGVPMRKPHDPNEWKQSLS